RGTAPTGTYRYLVVCPDVSTLSRARVPSTPYVRVLIWAGPCSPVQVSVSPWSAPLHWSKRQRSRWTNRTSRQELSQFLYQPSYQPTHPSRDVRFLCFCSDHAA